MKLFVSSTLALVLVPVALHQIFLVSPMRGLDWPTWRDALIMWIEPHHSATMSEVIELLLLSRCAGFYHQCLGQEHWYDTIEWQTTDLLSTILQRDNAPVF